MADYEHARVAVDAAVFTIKEKELYVLLHRREKEPFASRDELPGGLLLPSESAEETLKRKLSDFVGKVDQDCFQQFFTFTEPKRDPRTRTVSIAFVALVKEAVQTDAAVWRPYRHIDSLAFDHLLILRAAREYLRKNAGLALIQHLLPDLFRLNEVHSIFETLLDRRLDNRNFRRWVLGSGHVLKTKQVTKNVSHRPASLYKLSPSLELNV